MKQWALITIYALAGLALLFVGLLTPAHIRAVDARTLLAAGRSTPSLVGEGLELVKAGKIGPARLLLQVSKENNFPSYEPLQLSLERISDPRLLAYGGYPPGWSELSDPGFVLSTNPSILSWFLALDARERVASHLQNSSRFEVRQILRTRSLTNLVHFSPVASPSGQPLDAAVLLAGLLLEGDHVSKPLREGLASLAFSAMKRGDVEPLELAYLDLVVLGNRLDWAQLTSLLQVIPNLDTLRAVAQFIQTSPDIFSTFYAAAILSGSPDGVLAYLERSGPSTALRAGQSGLTDLTYSLGAGRGAVQLLLQRQARVVHPRWRMRLAEYEPFHLASLPLERLARRAPAFALVIKYVFILAAGLLFTQAIASFMPRTTAAGRRWLTLNRLLALGCFLLVMFATCEPFVMGSSPLSHPGAEAKSEIQTTSAAVTGFTTSATMDVFTVLVLVVFLLIQSAIYTVCLMRIAEIRRQPVSSQLKLKLLENEEYMFDAGLYCGLGGTVVALMLYAMGIGHPSLMAAYSSTLFGVVFVALLKICHLRPFRRTLLLSAEAPAL